MATETKRHFIPGITVPGTLRYPKLNSPDTKGKYADGKFKTNFVLDAEDTAAFKKHLKAVAAKICPDIDDPRLPIQTDKKDGTVSFIFKKKNKPMLVDAKRKAIPADVKIGGGTTARIAFTLMNYDKGITALLDCVQVIDLKEGGGFDVSQLDEIEGGFEAPTDAAGEDPSDRFADAEETEGEPASGAEAAKDKKFAL